MNETKHLRIKLLVGVWTLLLLLASLYAIRLFLLPFILGGLLALLIQPYVDVFEGRYRFSRNSSISLAFGLFLVPLAGLALYVGPQILEELRQLQTNRTQFVTSISERYHQVKKEIRQQTPKLYNAVPWKYVEKEWLRPEKWLAKDKFDSIWSQISHGLEWLFHILILSPMVAFFLLKDGSTLKHWGMHFVPNRYFEMVMEILYGVNRQIVAFVRGQFWDSSINAFLLSVALSIVGLPYAILVGIFAGVANAIPMIGPLIAGSASVLIAILTGSVNPWLVFTIFMVIHIVDITIIYPQSVGHSLRLHEFVVILGVFAGGYIGGIIGMLVAVPMIGIAVRSTETIFRTLRGYRIL